MLFYSSGSEIENLNSIVIKIIQKECVEFFFCCCLINHLLTSDSKYKYCRKIRGNFGNKE